MARKRKPNRDKGEAVRLSNAVLAVLKPKLKRGESYDNLLRRMLGLPSRKNEAQTRAIFWVLPQTLIATKNLAEARGEAILAAVQQGKQKAEKPIKVIECI
jgi:hypothetical protein